MARNIAWIGIVSLGLATLLNEPMWLILGISVATAISLVIETVMIIKPLPK